MTAAETYDRLQERFGCIGLEATALRHKGKAMAEAFCELHKYYAVEHITRSEGIKSQLETGLQYSHSLRESYKYKGGLKDYAKRARIAAKINGQLKQMWETFRDAKRLEQELMFAHRIFALEIDERHFVTTLFDVLETGGELFDGQKTADGREAYIILQKSALAHWLGYDADKTEEIWYTHGFYYRN
jgi:hypothetical protein